MFVRGEEVKQAAVGREFECSADALAESPGTDRVPVIDMVVGAEQEIGRKLRCGKRCGHGAIGPFRGGRIAQVRVDEQANILVFEEVSALGKPSDFHEASSCFIATWPSGEVDFSGVSIGPMPKPRRVISKVVEKLGSCAGHTNEFVVMRMAGGCGFQALK